MSGLQSPNKTEDFIQKGIIVHSNKYDYDKSVFINNRTKILIHCKEHGDFLQFPSNHLKGSGCSKCASDKRKITKMKIPFDKPSCKKLTQEEVIERFKKVHSNIYDYSKVIYTNRNKMVTIICKEHGEFEMLSYSHWNGSGCPKCNKTSSGKKFTQEEVIERFKKIHSDTYDYSKVIYTKNTEKVIILCKEHGEFEMLPYYHWGGSGCPKCRIPSGKISDEKIIERLYNLKETNDTFEKVEYVNMHTPVIITCKKHGDYKKSLANYFSGFRCPKCSPKSKFESDVMKLFPFFIQNSRKIIEPLEIDLFSEYYAFGIEINGIMFHSYGLSKYPLFNNIDLLCKNKHLNKTQAMEEKGYQLLHIKDTDWNNPIKQEIWKSVINNKIGKSYKFFARKLKIINLTDSLEFVKSYLNENHLQGYCNYLYAYGLCNEKNEVYSIMTFGKSRFDKNIEYELLRFCNLKNTSVIGGASKLLKYFERINDPKSLISYAKRDWSQGKIYEKLGFVFKHNTEPSIFWVDSKKITIHSRQKFQKHKLKDIPNFDFNEKLTADENLFKNGYRKYFDSGNKVYYKIYKKGNIDGNTITYIK